MHGNLVIVISVVSWLLRNIFVMPAWERCYMNDYLEIQTKSNIEQNIQTQTHPTKS